MLTMEEIENISFRRAGLGGYKVEDVDTFVDGVIEKVRQLELSNKELQARIDKLNKQVIHYESQADSVQDAIITAEKTAKKLVRDAAAEADKILSDARQQADQTTKTADEQAAATVNAAELRAQTVLNSALSRSAAGIDENNRTIEQQKQHIIQIQTEVTRFRDALIDSYKEHLRLINSLPKAEEFRQYQERMEEKYPPAAPVAPEAVQEEVWKEADQAVEQAKQETQIQVEMVDADKVKEISEEMRTNSKARAALAQEQADAADDDQLPQRTTLAPEETMELPKLTLVSKDDSADSNLDDIQAAVQQDKNSDTQDSEPKPTSIDEIGDGLIFGSTDTEKPADNSQNHRRPIRFGKDKPKAGETSDE